MSTTAGSQPDELILVDTPVGVGRLHVRRAQPGSASSTTIMLGHGAGGGVDAVDLTALADHLPGLGISVIRFEQPWHVAGKKVAVLPPKLDLAWIAAVAAVRDRLAPSMLIFGGRSAGARVACRTSVDQGANGVVCCAFPLHPPGRPEKSRLAELLIPTSSVLVIQGSNDSFGSAELFRTETTGRDDIAVVEVPGADHGMRVGKNPVKQATVRELIIDAVVAYAGVIAGARP